jgi:putative membrane protein
MNHGFLTLLTVSLFTGAGAFAQSQVTPTAGALSDKQIAEVLVTINQGEIDAAKLAKSRAQNADVKAFAEKMIQEHTKNKEATIKLAHKNSLRPEESEMSKTLKVDAANSNKELRSVKTGFDLAYINQQISMHEKALSTLKTDLLPNSKNAELKAHLESTENAVASHLATAKDLQSKVH